MGSVDKGSEARNPEEYCTSALPHLAALACFRFHG